jgi:hypothetical protein
MEASAIPGKGAAPVATATCPSCGGASIDLIYAVQSIPLHSCILLDSPEAARAFPRRDLELAFCDGCGFVFNASFDEAAMAYSANFEESQHFSETFNTFARDLAREIAATCDVAGKCVVEIGCGKGEFLAELCRTAGARGIGIDPAYRADPGRTAGAGDLRFLAERFGPAHFALPADIVACRHTLEHIAPVRGFLDAIRKMIGPREDVWVVFETPDAARVLGEGAFWDIYYEHCSYFSAGTHADLFKRGGFAVHEVKLVYAGQYIVQYARPTVRADAPIRPDERAVAEMRHLAEAFPDKVRQAQDRWRDRIDRAQREGRSVVLWGGGSKAVSFLTTLGIGPEVRAAVDVNPYKQGKYTPGSAHPVIAPAALTASPPDTVIVMNPIYLPEVRAMLGSLGLKPDIMAL